MKGEKYPIDSIYLLKKEAREGVKKAKGIAEKKEEEYGYHLESLMGDYALFWFLKNKASILEIDEEGLGIADLDPLREFMI